MWNTISSYDLSFKAAGFASCILLDEKMRVSDGGTPTALEIFRAVNAGTRVDFTTSDELGVMQCDNPVVGAVRTFGKAVRVVFEDDRAVELTTGHVLPMESTDTELAHQDWIILAGMVRAGMLLRDGRVKKVDDLGRRHAIRMWTHHPAWLTTASGLSIGSRWHEIMEGWLSYHEQDEEDEYGPTSVDVWDRVYGLPVSSGQRCPYTNEPRPARWIQDWRGQTINRATLGRVDHILYTLKERGDMRATCHGPSSDRQLWGRPNRLELSPVPRGMPRRPLGLGTWGDDPRRAMTLPVASTRPLLARHKWSDLRSLLTEGPDVVTDAAA